MNPQQHQPRPKISNYVYYILSIFVTGVIICTTILYVSGALDFVIVQSKSLVPRFASYQKLSEITDYSSVKEIFASQPQISYSKDAKYLFVEISDLNCPNCARFHGYQSNDGDYSFRRLKQDFMDTGKVNYMFLDKRFLMDSNKHLAAYCMAEQSSKRFFDFKEAVYKDYSNENTFNLDKAKSYIDNTIGFNMKQFEDCYSSRKYDDRITKITNFTTTTFNASSTPTFLLFKFEDIAITKIDGKKGIDRNYTQVWTTVGNVDYDAQIKPGVQAQLNKN